MFAEKKNLAIGVFCADWRLHQDGVRINSAVREYLGVDGLDVIALPGPDGVCAEEYRARDKEVLTEWLKVLIGAHQPTTIAFVPHCDCLEHAVGDGEHEVGSQKMLMEFRELTGFRGEMVALCASYQDDMNWPLREIARLPAHI